MLEADQLKELGRRIRLSNQSLVAFRHIFLQNGKSELLPAPFHKEWSDILLHEEDSYAIEGFRESAKSQYILRAFPLHCLRFPSKKRDFIVIIRENKDLAMAKLLEIEEEYLSNPALKTNLVRIKQKSASIFSVDVRAPGGEVMNIRFEAFGKGSAIRGLANLDRRPKICLIDDPQDIKDAQSDTVMDNDWRWFLSDINFLGQHTRIFMIGNNLGEKCIIERVFANASDLGFKIRKISIIDEETGESAWPSKYSPEMIEKEKEAFRRLGQLDVWMRERMCRATSPETRVFDLNDIIRYSYLYVDNIIKDCNFFITVDPASSTKHMSDYRSIVVNAVTEDNRWIIVDVVFGRWASDDFIDQLFHTVVKWHRYLSGQTLMPVGIEKGHFKQILEPFIKREMQRRNVFFDIKPIEHAKEGSKLERIKALGPRFKAHTIMFPETAPWLAEMENELLGIAIKEIKCMNDDLVDALSMQYQIANPPVGKSRNFGHEGTLQEVGGYNPLTGAYAR